MSTIVTIDGGDSISASRADINANFAALNTDKIETSVLDTDTSLAADSDAKIPTQKAVKAYVDTQGGANASETARGIVEEATDAEVAAATATGGTGAKLFVSPAKLAASRYSPTTSLNAGETINGATLPVPVFQNKTDNELYACDANDNTKYKFIGFAISNSTDGNSITLQTAGVVSGFTGLDEGEKYYVQDAAGTIGSTPGTMEILVGVAISPTQLLIQKGARRAHGVFSIAANTEANQVITLGFRPSVIRLFAYSVNPDPSFASGTWINGTYAGAGVSTDESGSAAVGNAQTSYIAKTDRSDGTQYHRFTITSVTDNGFTITDDENDSISAPQTDCRWEAEGYL